MVWPMREVAAKEALHQNKCRHREDSRTQPCAALARPAREVCHCNTEDRDQHPVPPMHLHDGIAAEPQPGVCLLYTSPSPRDRG